MTYNEMNEKQIKSYELSISANEKYEMDIDWNDDELEYLKENHCAEDWNLKSYCSMGRCGEDADCRECWDYAKKHRFDD